MNEDVFGPPHRECVPDFLKNMNEKITKPQDYVWVVMYGGENRRLCSVHSSKEAAFEVAREESDERLDELYNEDGLVTSPIEIDCDPVTYFEHYDHDNGIRYFNTQMIVERAVVQE